MANLLHETNACMADLRKKPEDVMFIGSESSGHSCTWEEFEVLANREYDAGYGGQEVAKDLVIVFHDGLKMWRGEYDGSEWWEYQTPFVRPPVSHKITNLFAKVGWASLEDLCKSTKGED